jgi:glucose/arabinose dehydrogenase
LVPKRTLLIVPFVVSLAAVQTLAAPTRLDAWEVESVQGPETINLSPRGIMAGTTAEPGGILPGNPAIQLVQIAGGLVDPANVASANDGSGRLFVVERIGRIRIIDKDGTLPPEPFLDLSSNAGGPVEARSIDQGMLGLVFHPNYATNGRFFVAYTDIETDGALLVVEFHVSTDNPNKAAPSADPARWGGGGRVLLAVPQPHADHNGGTMHFGPDGYLYLALGDGGCCGDPYHNAQDLSSLLGKLLRIDVDRALGNPGEATSGRAGMTQPYGIPPDNPFASVPGLLPLPIPTPPTRQEIWAYGLREPWQFSFDSATGDLYIADVGQDAAEEVDFQQTGDPGGQNYGWNHMEGGHCYPKDAADCVPLGVLPVAEYKHGPDGCAIVGIGVYRGGTFPMLDGIYFNADFCSGKIWGLLRGEGSTWVYQELLDTDLRITGAGADEAGNLYVTACNCELTHGYDPLVNPQGTVWQLIAAS